MNTIPRGRGGKHDGGTQMINPRLFGRTRTILETMEWMLKINAKTLIEIGTCRNLSFPTWTWDAIEGDGRSTIAWGQYAETYGLRVHTVDIDPAAIEFCKSITAQYAEHIEYHNEDAEDFINRHEGKIDVWYLDGVDDLEKRARMARAIFPKMAARSLVLFDDIGERPPLFRGGASLGSTTIPWLIESGYKIIFSKKPQLLLGRGI
jgi:hypothetical protein